MTGVNLYSRLLRYVRPYRWAFGLAVLGMMVVAAGDLMLAWLVIPIGFGMLAEMKRRDAHREALVTVETIA